MAEQKCVDLDWHDGFMLGHAQLDSIHEEFVHLIWALGQAEPGSVVDELERLRLHCRQHFAEEERWMRETDFPARDCHANEHAAVLRSVDAVCLRAAQGNLAVVDRLVRALREWFPAHADYLDAPLAHWMNKRRFGGKPIVFRRRLPYATADLTVNRQVL